MNRCECRTCPQDAHETVSVCGGLACHAQSRPVTARTMLLMLKPEFFDQVGDRRYRFCASPDCPVVYFYEDHRFTVNDLRVRVGLKEKHDPIPLCYCFGFNDEDVRREFRTQRRTTILDRIKSLVKEGMCACEERNPSGTCCLGDVARVVERLMQEEK